MRKIVDIIALERELQNRIEVLNSDNVFLNTNGATNKLNALVERLQVVTFIKKNFEVIEWLMGNDNISRKRLLNQIRRKAKRNGKSANIIFLNNFNELR